MKKLIPTIALLLGSCAAVWAAAPVPLTSLRQIRALSDAEASQSLPVAFEATVTYYCNLGVDLFVQEGDEAIYVEAKPGAGLVVGDLVLVRGKTRNSFGTDIFGENVTLLHHGLPPMPVVARYEQLIRAEFDCMRVVVHATVRSADTADPKDGYSAYLKLLLDGGPIDAEVVSGDAHELHKLLDAEVEVTGVVSAVFDNKKQLTGIVLELPSLDDVKMLKRAETSPESLPFTPMDKVLSASYVLDQTRRVRVQGTITYYQPGLSAVLQDGAKSLWISTSMSEPLRVGDHAEASGFPFAHSSFLTLTDGEIQDSHIFAPVAPQPSTWHQLSEWNASDGHQNDLVAIEGQVTTAVREASQDEFVIISEGKLVTAIYRHPLVSGSLPPIKQVPLGARVRVVGICMALQGDTINANTTEVPFNILLRSYDDIEIVAKASLLNIRNLILVVCSLLLVVFAVLIRGWVLERKVRRQTAALATLEQRRSRILEDINGSRPLAEIIEEIADMVTCRLDGASCWCEITDGARLGKCPPGAEKLRIAQREIPARTGPPLGTLFAAFGPLTKPCASESEALTTGAALATLAIETRKLYSDLLHRSEFDLLTDIHNRFSLEKRLDAQIEEARQGAGIFGLIYVDLDGFKQVNDLYGHRIGDLYLQEVARRMKQQLRSHDLLARLGGDEFAVVLPMVRNRAGVEEIAQRLEHCFKDPLELEGVMLQGSASFGIGLYPEDGGTRDSLVSAADTDMYATKNYRKQFASVTAVPTVASKSHS
ncbi:MAG: GGDEF domain-containing protein [Terracidiphilus sp.]